MAAAEMKRIEKMFHLTDGITLRNFPAKKRTFTEDIIPSEYGRGTERNS
jgi:hypothetical protein